MKAVIRHVDLPVPLTSSDALGHVNDRGESPSVEMSTQQDDERIVSIETLRSGSVDTIRIWLVKQ